jgi:hypothetical protein
MPMEVTTRYQLLGVGFAIATAAFAQLAPSAQAQPVKNEREAFGRIALRPNAATRIDTQRLHGIADVVERWNAIALDATGFDHTPVAPGDSRVFGEQLGPARSSRAMAIIHIAMFEALNAIDGQFVSYLGLVPVDKSNKVNSPAALAAAAHRTLVAMFPSQTATFDELLAADLAEIADGAEKMLGVEIGQSAANAILEKRSQDGSGHAEPLYGGEFVPSNAPGKWRQDPISQIPIALGANWSNVEPFVLTSPGQFRIPVPPSLQSAAYATAFNEVKSLGGDGLPSGTATQRTAEQSFIGTFWAYDGTPSLCAPPRLYNQVVVAVAKQQHTKGIQFARLLALANIALADAALAAWDSKFFYQFWRPITGIREADAGTGPTGTGDNNPNTAGDALFTPLAAPASNLGGPNFTPPFPSYPSGHASLGGALFETLRRFYGKDDVSFTVVSDEWNGSTRDVNGTLRPRQPRSFSTFSAAEEENGQSRVYLGIHWAFDKTEGIKLGRRVGESVFDKMFREQCKNGNCRAPGAPLVDPLATN